MYLYWQWTERDQLLIIVWWSAEGEWFTPCFHGQRLPSCNVWYFVSLNWLIGKCHVDHLRIPGDYLYNDSVPTPIVADIYLLQAQLSRDLYSCNVHFHILQITEVKYKLKRNSNKYFIAMGTINYSIIISTAELMQLVLFVLFCGPLLWTSAIWCVEYCYTKMTARKELENLSYQCLLPDFQGLICWETGWHPARVGGILRQSLLLFYHTPSEHKSVLGVRFVLIHICRKNCRCGI